jgi:hypothetical protein
MTEKKLNTRLKAYSTVATITYVESWLLDSTAFFYIAREEPNTVDKSRSSKRIRIVNS